LSKIGESRIMSFEDPNEQARLARSLYEIVRDAEIEGHCWHFAKTRVMIPAEVEKPAFDWPYQYLLPSDCLRVLTAGSWPQPVMDDYVGWDSSAYTIEGRHLLARRGPAMKLLYLRREADSGFYPPTFIEALACKLAVEMAERRTGGSGKRELAWKEYELAVRQAKRVNAIQLPPQKVADDSWMLAHMEGSW
jgi:uncharacterized protein YifE (UPF0438 family)